MHRSTPISDKKDDDEVDTSDTIGWGTDKEIAREEWEELFHASDDEEPDSKGLMLSHNNEPFQGYQIIIIILLLSLLS